MLISDLGIACLPPPNPPLPLTQCNSYPCSTLWGSLEGQCNKDLCPGRHVSCLGPAQQTRPLAEVSPRACRLYTIRANRVQSALRTCRISSSESSSSRASGTGFSQRSISRASGLCMGALSSTCRVQMPAVRMELSLWLQMPRDALSCSQT